MDEHRIGLKPIVRRIWAPKGERPIAFGHHRYEWLYVWGFVEPASGATVWHISSTVCKEMFEAILADFAKSAGVGKDKRIVLQLDCAGWHGPKNLAVPDGIRLVFQPAYSPELQPAEHLPSAVDLVPADHFFIYILHHPFGLTVPSTVLQDDGGSKTRQFAQLCSPFGVS